MVEDRNEGGIVIVLCRYLFFADDLLVTDTHVEQLTVSVFFRLTTSLTALSTLLPRFLSTLTHSMYITCTVQ